MKTICFTGGGSSGHVTPNLAIIKPLQKENIKIVYIGSYTGIEKELIQKEKAFKKDLFELNYQRKMGRVEKPHRFKEIKRHVARVMTILKERDNQNERNSPKNQ